MLHIGESGKSLADPDIEQCENRLGLSLPDQYRHFLLQHNGGLPTPDVVDVAGLSQSPTDVQVFFGIYQTISSNELDWNVHAFEGRLPKGAIPIACDYGGNLFCLQCVGAGCGSVLYVDLRQTPQCSYFIAPSFDEFLTKIR